MLWKLPHVFDKRRITSFHQAILEGEPLCAQSILPQQRLLAEPKSYEGVLAVVRDEEICERLRGRWQRDQGRLTAGDISTERWAELCTEIDKVQPNLQIYAAFAEFAWAQGLT